MVHSCHYSMCCMYLAHHELESKLIMITLIITVVQGLLRGLEGFPGLGGHRSLAGAGQEGQVVQPLPAGSLGSRNRRVPKRVPLYVRLY